MAFTTRYPPCYCRPRAGELLVTPVKKRRLEKINFLRYCACRVRRRADRPVAIEPGRYTVILEQDAAVEIVQLLRGALDARSAAEGRSFFACPGGGTKLETKIVDDRVTLVADLANAKSTIAEEGMPARRSVWIERGVLRNPDYSRYWVEKQGSVPTAAPDAIRATTGSASSRGPTSGGDIARSDSGEIIFNGERAKSREGVPALPSDAYVKLSPFGPGGALLGVRRPAN